VRRGGALTADMESLCTIFLLAVSLSGARVLAQVLGPGFHDETFDEAPGVRRVVKQTPSDRAVSPSNSSQFPHGLPKSVDLIRINPELGLNEHRSLLKLRLDHHNGVRPVHRRNQTQIISIDQSVAQTGSAEIQAGSSARVR
jgi:hypothetical protein